jgi:hypothetical protein
MGSREAGRSGRKAAVISFHYGFPLITAKHDGSKVFFPHAKRGAEQNPKSPRVEKVARFLI